MADSDPSFLFTPPKSLSPVTPTSPSSRLPSTGDLFTPVAFSSAELPNDVLAPGPTTSISFVRRPESMTSNGCGFYIDVPDLPDSTKAQYKPLSDGLAADIELDVRDMRKIIGEYRDANVLYYFVKFENGMSHKYRAREFRFKYPDLVKAYEHDKRAGLLPPFDPSGSYVHMKSRYKMTITINKRTLVAKSTALPASFGGLTERPESEYDDESDLFEVSESEGENDDSDYYQRDTPKKHQRVLRVATKKAARALPFSPKKLRSNRALFTPYSEDELSLDSEDKIKVIPTRRSGRTRRSAKANLADDDAYQDQEEEDAEGHDVYEDASHKSKAKAKKKAVRGKASRAAYGRFRTAADLDYDSHSDEETSPLRAHRDVCEKCHRRPAHVLLEAERKKSKTGRRRRRGSDDDLESEGDEEDKLVALGGWVRCLRCPVSAHWRCLASTQRHEILKAARDHDRTVWRAAHTAELSTKVTDIDASISATEYEPAMRSELGAYEITEFICNSCVKGGICMGCKEVALEADTGPPVKLGGSDSADYGNPAAKPADIESSAEPPTQMDAATTDDMPARVVLSTAAQISTEGEQLAHVTPHELLFRCFTCKRLSHYRHLPIPLEYRGSEDSVDAVMLANHYQSSTEWHCADCMSFKYDIDKIIAWRPYPSNTVEPLPLSQPPNHKSQLPREYLIKWVDRSYRRTQWVPHMWLLARSHVKLKNFLATGTKVSLLEEPVSEEIYEGAVIPLESAYDGGAIPFEIGAEESRASSVKPGTKTPSHPAGATPDAERRIPPAWKTVDRVLDVLLWYPKKRKEITRAAKGKRKGKTTGKSKHSVEDSDEIDDSDGEACAGVALERDSAFNDGEPPSEDVTESVHEWESRNQEQLSVKHIDEVVWAFFKWNDLGYDEATWDSPPRREDPSFVAFEKAFERFIDSRSVTVPKRSKIENTFFDNRVLDGFRTKYAYTNDAQPSIGQSKQLSLMPFQVDGVNWLSNNWWNHQHCILADDMGLGKTVQIVSFIGTIIDRFEAFPALVVVPNSTITNWVREFERWAPRLRVVPFYGEAKAREVIKQFELHHEIKSPRTTGAKYHVLITTYDNITNPKDFTPIFKNTPRWEVLVVDEGQRLKNDHSLLFKKLNELNTIHRIILTGTPLNNNIRELFNLMNFLDPEEWHDLEKLEKEHEVLTEELITQLHNRLRPYFLRRIKSEVLQLPPKNEVIVPVSMTPLQKEVYRSILSQNLNLLKSLTQHSNKQGSSIAKSNMNNILMQMRKCLQHPYLNSEDIEPRGLTPEETQEKLISASAKLRLLKVLLPKLRERGHRVLLFSQFVIALHIIEDFLVGEGMNYLRLDGETKQADRQKGMDEFNRPHSDIFIYLLTTRAGGVGINLYTADTVIIFDPDFNPHQDLQAIARAYRYGQTKTCLVFKLMVKDSAEERIMQTGKKKLVLDHLIVQKMDDDDSAGDDVQSMLTFGAKALFEDDQNTKDIVYTDHDIEKLIEKTEKEGDQIESDKNAGFAFAFAKVWSADKDSMEEMTEGTDANHELTDAWAQTLERIGAEREILRAQEITGRGARRRAAAAVAVMVPHQSFDFDDAPQKVKKKRGHKSKSKSVASDSDAYTGSVADGSDEDTDPSTSFIPEELTILNENPEKSRRKSKRPPKPSGDSVAASAFPHDDGRTTGVPMSNHSHYRDQSYVMPLYPIQNQPNQNDDEERQICGLCGMRHGPGACYMTESSENLAQYRQILLLHADDEPLEERRAAIEVIDETLSSRGMLHLIHGQPLQLVGLSTANLPPKKLKDVDESVELASAIPSHAAHLRSKTPKVTAGAKISGSQSVFPTRPSSPPLAGPSKRPASPLDVDVQKKKKSKLGASSSKCPICGTSPHHLVIECPAVAEGPSRVSKEIRRLDQDSSMSGTVQILRKILKKQTKRELTQGSPSQDVVMLSE